MPRAEANRLLCVHSRGMEGWNGVPVFHAQVIRERIDNVFDPDYVLYRTESKCEPHHCNLRFSQHGDEFHEYVQY